MTSSGKKLALYGLSASQPARAVAWLLSWKGVPYKFVKIMPGQRKAGGSRSPEYLAMCPSGTIPCIKDDELVLWESNAILTYLADKYQWNDLYPRDPARRAKIDQFLHWHHYNSRRFTIGLFAPILRPDLKLSADELQATKKKLVSVAGELEGALSRADYLCGAEPSLADIAVYEDVGQCSKENLDIFDFERYPCLRQWFARMEGLPQYEKNHAVLQKLKPFFHPKSSM